MRMEGLCRYAVGRSQLKVMNPCSGNVKCVAGFGLY